MDLIEAAFIKEFAQVLYLCRLLYKFMENFYEFKREKL